MQVWLGNSCTFPWLSTNPGWEVPRNPLTRIFRKSGKFGKITGILLGLKISPHEICNVIKFNDKICRATHLAKATGPKMNEFTNTAFTYDIRYFACNKVWAMFLCRLYKQAHFYAGLPFKPPVYMPACRWRVVVVVCRCR